MTHLIRFIVPMRKTEMAQNAVLNAENIGITLIMTKKCTHARIFELTRRVFQIFLLQ
jgi:hypothetical protein